MSAKLFSSILFIIVVCLTSYSKSLIPKAEVNQLPWVSGKFKEDKIKEIYSEFHFCEKISGLTGSNVLRAYINKRIWFVKPQNHIECVNYLPYSFCIDLAVGGRLDKIGKGRTKIGTMNKKGQLAKTGDEICSGHYSLSNWRKSFLLFDAQILTVSRFMTFNPISSLSTVMRV